MTKSLLKEFVNQAALKKSDGSDAGKSDVSGKVPTADVKFSLMRNTINSDGKVNGSDVANYLEKAHDINDEVDTVLYGLETSDGDVVKVYVNATQADAFEVEMKKLLGMEDDIEEAINDLATRFDIVDVVWPKGQGPDGEGDGPNGEDADDNDLDMDQQAELGDPANDEEPPADDEEPPADDEMEVIASADDIPADKQDSSDTKKKPVPTNGSADDEEPPADDEEPPADDEEPPADDEEPPADDAKISKKKSPPGDKHANLKNVGKAMKTTEHLGDSNMSIGNKFLQRVLGEGLVTEADDRDRDGVQDGISIPMDTQQRSLANKLKWRLPKQIVQLFAMIGIPGVKLNAAEAETSISDAAEMLRSQISVRRAFLDFFKAYASVKGYSTAAPSKMEESFQIDEAKLKRGNYTQKTLETILVKLGLPENLVSTTGPGIVGSALYRASKDVEENADLKAKMRVLAMRLGIKPADAMAPLDDAEQVSEAIDPSGADMYADAVMGLVAAMGVPDAAFNRQARMIIAKEFRNMRADTNVSALLSLIKRFSVQFSAAKSRVTRAAPAVSASMARGGQGTV